MMSRQAKLMFEIKADKNGKVRVVFKNPFLEIQDIELQQLIFENTIKSITRQAKMFLRRKTG